MDWTIHEQDQQQEYLDALQAESIVASPLFLCPGFHIGSAMPDYMHDDLLGVRGQAVASILSAACKGQWFWQVPEGRGGMENEGELAV